MRTVLSTPQGPCQAEIGEFGGVGKSGDVERARSTRAGGLQDVEVDHRRSITQATAKAWVQDKRGLVTGIGVLMSTRHETEQPRETCAPEYAPLDGSVPCLWSFSGSYGWTFTGSVLDGIWGSSGLPW